MKQYVVDAFTTKIFSGNPAAVCILDDWIEESIMQKIAIENNLSETAFSVKHDNRYHIRWFTPGGEVSLCGHATLATSFVITNFIEPDLSKIIFDSLSGELIVKKKNDLFELDFPTNRLHKINISKEIIDAIGVEPTDAYAGDSLLLILKSEEQVRNLTPDFSKIKKLDGQTLSVTAPAKNYDFVSRTFVPKLNVNEDPVCGSAHCYIVPYWQEKLNKTDFIAYQASARGGVLHCSYADSRTKISGNAALYSIAKTFI